MCLFRLLKFMFILFVVLFFVSLITFYIVVGDDIKENGFFLKSWDGDKGNEEEKYDLSESQDFLLKMMEFDIHEEDFSVFEEDVISNIGLLDSSIKRKLLDLYLDNLDKLLEVELVYLNNYELDIIEYLKDNSFSLSDVNDLEGKDYLKDYLIRLDNEGLLIVKEDYVERFTLEIDYNRLVSNFEGLISDSYLLEWVDKRKNSLQYNLRSRNLYK